MVLFVVRVRHLAISIQAAVSSMYAERINGFAASLAAWATLNVVCRRIETMSAHEAGGMKPVWSGPCARIVRRKAPALQVRQLRERTNKH